MRSQCALKMKARCRHEVETKTRTTRRSTSASIYTRTTSIFWGIALQRESHRKVRMDEMELGNDNGQIKAT